jgi:choline kinase
MKEAIILAAGRGSRLDGVNDGSPKSLLQVGDQTLIEHNVRAMQAVGIERIHVVVGYRAEHVMQTLNGLCEYVVNEKFDRTNSLYSLWLAREKVRGSFLLMNSDVLAHPEIFRRLASESHSALAYDSGSGFDDEHMKVSVHNGYLTAIDKQLPTQDSCGENVGVLRFTAGAGEALFEEADRLVNNGHRTTWAPKAVGAIAERVAIRCVDVADLPWIEIDFCDDLEQARSQVWPSIQASSPINNNGVTH